MTISYAQATKRLSFNEQQQTNQNTNGNTNSTMTTSMSTLTQSTLDEALEKIRNETARSMEQLRTDMQEKIKSMETSIAAAVINAIRATPSMVQMEVEQSDAQSLQSSTQDTATTIKTLADQFEALTNVVQLLTKRVGELSEQQQEQTQNKWNRPADLPPRKLSPALTTNNQSNSNSQSPPTKLSRSSVPTPPKTPPPNGTPATAGSREGS
jgi:chromosome segregation ATPase